jgi:hypothetical protein
MDGMFGAGRYADGGPFARGIMMMGLDGESENAGR